jgi:beta-lactam-binding protein with PASTA domain
VKIRIRYRHNPDEVSAGAGRAFRIGMTLLAMTAVALLSALITMRLAIHTGEVEIPNLSGITVEEAAEKTNQAQLNLTIENRFYSTTVPAGRVPSQSPAAGVSVRKGWHMRITESLGPQRVTIPDTVGMNERDAGMAIRRSSLDIGSMSHLPSPSATDTVLAQTPPANAEGVDKPEVSLLLSEPESASPKAYVMPSLVGLSYTAAGARMREMDLHLYAIVPQAAAAPVDPANPTAAPAPPVAMVPAGVVVTQTPAAGMRVSAADNPHVKMSAGAPANPTAAPAATPAAVPRPVVIPPAAPVVRQPPAVAQPLVSKPLPSKSAVQPPTVR